MKTSAKAIILFSLILLNLFLFVPKIAAQDLVIIDAKVVEVEKVVEEEGLKTQKINVEILSGDFKGNIKEIQVTIDENFIRPIKVGDRVKLAQVDINDQKYFQFYDFKRSQNYTWLFLLFLVVMLMFFGWRGFKTAVPSMILMLLLIIGIFPDYLPNLWLITGGFLTLVLLALVTSWIRLRNKILTTIVVFSVMFCLFISFLVFAGFSQSAYIYPFIGSVSGLSSEVFQKVLDIVLISSIFIPAGAVLNASIQITKHLDEEFENSSNIKEMLKTGIRVSQKVASGELNNLIMIIIGSSIAGIYLVKNHFEGMSFWDNGWVALQVITIISSGLSILLVAPITVFMTAAVKGLLRGKRQVKGQGRLNVGK